QVVGRRSLAELETAITAVRGNADKTGNIVRREDDFRTLLEMNAPELTVSPGRAWLALLRQDFGDAVRLRQEVARYDALSGPEWPNPLEDSAALTKAVQEELQQPARRGLVSAAQHAAAAAKLAEATLRTSSTVVLGLLLLVLVLLMVSISVPV